MAPAAGYEWHSRDIAEVARARGLPAVPSSSAPRAPVGERIRAGLDRHLRTLIAHDPGTRRGADPEQLHQMRVSVRRMRAMLASGRDFLDQRWSEPLRSELGWLGRSLGPVRDLDVLQERLRASADALPIGERSPAARLLSGLEVERGEARYELLDALCGDRYIALIESLVIRVRDGDSGEESGPDSRTALRGLVLDRFHQLREAAERNGVDPTDEQLHAFRIAGKRLRYTAELAEPLFGKPARRLVKTAKDLQDVLGQHQDAHIAELRVRELLSTLGQDPEIAFVAGRLIEREAAQRAHCRARCWECWRKLRACADRF